MKKYRQLIAVSLCVLFCLTSITPSAGAYALNGCHIETMITFVPYSGFSSTTISHFNEALWQWNKYSGQSLMRRTPTETHSTTNYPSNDGNNYIYRVNTGTGDYVAQTTRYYNATTKVVASADINLNMYYKWANSAQSDRFDVWTVFVHEAGHVAGLAHSTNSSAVMYPTTKKNYLNRYPTQDDINGIQKIYGTSSASSTAQILIPDGNDANISVAVQCGVLREYSYSDLINESTLIVRATLTETSEPFQIIPTFGNSPSNFTDYYFNVTDVLRGDADMEPRITVRIQGGRVNNLDLIVEDAPHISIGDDVLLFLYQPNMGSGYNTEGEYYYILGVNQGIYYCENEAKIHTSEEYFTDCYGNELNYTDVLNQTSIIPLKDENCFYTEFMENVKCNYESGFITEEEYQQLMDETTQYATIVNSLD